MYRLKILILFTIFLFGCAPKQETATAVPFDRREMLSNLTYQIILPTHETLESSAEALVQSTQIFVGNPNAENLDSLQNAWLETNLAYMATTPFDFGPVHDTRLHSKLDNRPVDTAYIDETLANDTVITTNSVSDIGSNKIGLGAMEYLIFDAENGDTVILAAFQDDENADRRQAYLLALAENIYKTTKNLTAIWDTNGSNYAQWFVESSGEMESSMNMLVNQMLADLEEIITLRIGFPLGKLSGGVSRPEHVEAPYSQMSLPRIIATVEALQTIYSGGAGSGLDDYLDFLGATYEEELLSQVIHNQFDMTLEALNAVEDPLAIAVDTNSGQVEAAYQELNKLLVLLKVDMANHLGIVLTFNDNDGD
ncbi:MAG: imelysin family protein [Anaerolineae bacterium]|nr:imelysin family protein [Anaerolineae bacterium]